MQNPLNQAQQQAVSHFGTPLLVIAGAGSGKTLVITHKIAHLIQEKGFSPSQILAITFTNKAAKEMADRVAGLLPEGSEKPVISTFHAFCAQVLRQYFDRIGGKKDFVIIDGSDQKRLVKDLAKRRKLSDSIYPVPTLIQKIDQFKNQLISVDQAENSATDPQIAAIYRDYQSYLWTNGLIDFSDMLFWVNEIFKKVPDVLHQYQAKFHYVLVDEYQDTNLAQYALIEAICAHHQNLTVVGDFDQNIYGWRGASLRNILAFETDFPTGTTIKLEQNYRSTQSILNAANAVIQHNQNRREKRLWTDNPAGDPVVHYRGTDAQDEAKFIAESILEYRQQGGKLSDVAVLYRITALTRVLEDQLVQAQVPYRLIGGTRFFDRKEIKDVLAYLRLIHNIYDDFAFERICNTPPRDIGATTLKKCLVEAQDKQLPIIRLVQSGQVPVPKRSQNSLNEFLGLMEELRKNLDMDGADGVASLIQNIIDRTGYEAYLQREGRQEATQRLENIYELISLAREESLSLGEFLNKIALLSEVDQSEDGPEAITMMTLHTAKGLEFNRVYIAGFEENLLPHYRSKNNLDQEEEERRLCYVGITRGKEQVVLSSCQRRILFGEVWNQQPSRFVREIPSDVLEEKKSTVLSMATESRGETNTEDRYARKPEDIPSLSEGDWVKHSVWGNGRVIKMEGSGEDAIVHAEFQGQVKKLIQKYAPLTPLEPVAQV